MRSLKHRFFLPILFRLLPNPLRAPTTPQSPRAFNGFILGRSNKLDTNLDRQNGMHTANYKMSSNCDVSSMLTVARNRRFEAQGHRT